MKVLAGPASYKQQIKNFKAKLIATSATFVAAEDGNRDGWRERWMNNG